MVAGSRIQNFCSTNKLRFVTPERDRSMNTLWQEKEFDSTDMQPRIANEKYSRNLKNDLESLTEKAAEIEKTMFVKEKLKK